MQQKHSACLCFANLADCCGVIPEMRSAAILPLHSSDSLGNLSSPLPHPLLHPHLPPPLDWAQV